MAMTEKRKTEDRRKKNEFVFIYNDRRSGIVDRRKLKAIADKQHFERCLAAQR